MSDGQPRRVDWFAHNQWLTGGTLARFPGLRGRYRRLVAAQQQQRDIESASPNANAAIDEPEAEPLGV